MCIGAKIKKLRKQMNLTQTKLGEILGVQKNAVSKWECGRVTDIPGSKLRHMAKLFNVPLSYLIDDNDISNYEGVTPLEKNAIPMIDEIDCDTPILTNEVFEAYVNVGNSLKADFCLKCTDDSMINARIHDGDIVFIREQKIVDNGDIALVIIDGKATLKRVFHQNQNMLILLAENPKYEPIVYVGEELNQVRIIGKAIAFQSDVK